MQCVRLYATGCLIYIAIIMLYETVSVFMQIWQWKRMLLVFMVLLLSFLNLYILTFSINIVFIGKEQNVLQNSLMTMTIQKLFSFFETAFTAFFPILYYYLIQIIFR